MGRYGALGWRRRFGTRDHELVAERARARSASGHSPTGGSATSPAASASASLLAQAAAQDADLLLLDEPFTGVDRPTREALRGLLARWRDEGRTVIVATHDLESAARDYDLVALPQPPPGRIRPGRRDLHRGGPGGDVRRARRPGRRADRRRRPPPPRGRLTMDFLIEPFQAEFVRNGALAAALVGVLCGVVGCFVVLRGHGADGRQPRPRRARRGSRSPSSSPRAARRRYPTSSAIVVGALAAGLVTAAATSVILRRSRLREDTATAVVFVFMLALGVVLISRIEGYAVDLTAFLFGDVLGVAEGSAVTAVLAARSWRSSSRSTGRSCCSRSTASGPRRSACRSTASSSCCWCSSRWPS